MEIDLALWLSLALRWFHLLIGILWIGASFYFIWLDNSLTRPKDPGDDADGELWAVHGGGFYHNRKYMVAPAHMPEHLHWFKWEAYLTWVSGFALLCLIYYMNAGSYLIDEAKMALAPWQAVSYGVIFIFGGFMAYEVLCASAIGHNGVTGIIGFLIMTGVAYLLCHMFSDRGAFIHVGAIIGTVMAANVFAVIIPNQKKVVAALLKGEKPDPELGRIAKQRSTHNNYLTLPVLLIMVSSHYPMVYGHDYNWLVLAGLSASSWPLRQFFMLRHKGKSDYRYIAAGVLGFIAVMILSSVDFSRIGRAEIDGAGDQPAIVVTDAQARAIINNHCIQCHSDTPTSEAFDSPPLGATFNKLSEILKYNERIYAQTIASDAMPLGNETEMSEEERQMLGAWLRAQK